MASVERHRGGRPLVEADTAAALEARCRLDHHRRPRRTDLEYML
jgi:hypothetical protein